MAATVRGDRRDDLVGGTPFDLAAAQSAKRRGRVPEILVGTFLVALFALAGAWFYSTSTRSTGYLALRQDVQRGEIIESGDLTVYDVSTDAPLLGIRTSETALVIGKVALSDMKIGTLITADHFADKAQIPDGSGIVGLELAPGEFPTLSLRPGDRVRVVIIPEANLVSEAGQIVVAADSVEVVEVVETGGRARFISLTMPTELADRVVAADSQDRVRLIQVPES